MSDSELREALAAQHARNRDRRIEGVKHWVRFIEETPPEVWGPQLNRFIDSQLRSARESGLEAEHYRRVDRAGREREP